MSEQLESAFSLIAKFLNSDPEAIQHLQEASTRQLPASVKALLATPGVPPEGIVLLLMHEEQSTNGFWRLALATLVHAKHAGLAFNDISDELREKVAAPIESAERSLPELFTRLEVLAQSAAFMAKMESRSQGSTQPITDTLGRTKTQLNPRHIAESGSSPIIRLVNGGNGAYACLSFTLSDGEGNTVLSEELIAEDMLFISHSAMSAARGAFASAIKSLKEDQLVRFYDQETIDIRAKGIRDDLDAIVELLSKLSPVFIEKNS